jgi:threonine/homoserine efflux transporter RhtA
MQLAYATSQRPSITYTCRLISVLQILITFSPKTVARVVSIFQMSNFSRAVLYIMLAILLFGIQGAIIKHIGDRYSVQQIATFRNIFGLLPSFLVLYFSNEWQSGRRTIRLRQWKLALSRGIAIAIAQFFFYWSLTIMEFATASTLAFAGPLFIPHCLYQFCVTGWGWSGGWRS